MGTPNRANVNLGALEYYAKSAETSPRTSQRFVYWHPDKNLLGIVILILFSR
ncbi:hypothetical protein SAMN05446935_8356 [Burkholderia sp. YR290]|nr:hypothetical protein SAMN05446935_8356 [Burkholderia sp. YR290]